MRCTHSRHSWWPRLQWKAFGAKPAIGETFVVIGVGLIGQITVQLLRASGCRVIALDRKDARLKLCRQMGVETLKLEDTVAAIAAIDKFSGGRGCDGVIVAASTKSSGPLRLGAEVLRKRGRMVLVGVAVWISIESGYEKKYVAVSCSYGPVNDKSYEDQIGIVLSDLSVDSVILKYCICSLVMTLMLTH